MWKLAREDEERLSSVAPIELSGTEPPQPWVVHILEVNTMNFCAFAACPSSPSEEDYSSSLNTADAILVAVPNTLASEAVCIPFSVVYNAIALNKLRYIYTAQHD